MRAVIWGLAGTVGVDPRAFTWRQLDLMACAVYDRHAVLALICAKGLVPRKHGDWQLADFHPWLESGIDGARLTEDTVGGMDALAGGNRKRFRAKDVRVV